MDPARQVVDYNDESEKFLSILVPRDRGHPPIVPRFPVHWTEKQAKQFVTNCHRNGDDIVIDGTIDSSKAEVIRLQLNGIELTSRIETKYLDSCDHMLIFDQRSRTWWCM